VSSRTRLGSDFVEALGYAVDAHGDQRRKGTDIPYAAHLLAVCSLVLEAGGSETQAIAALLHDAAEDCGGQPRLDDIRLHFGDEVGDIVEACSDSLSEAADQKLPWEVRKTQYLEHLHDAKADVLLVSLADKLHNATAIVRDVRAGGHDVFERFKGKRTGTLWYYDALAKAFDERRGDLEPGGIVLLAELQLAVEAMTAA
jgi:(p)ppGpp synthase/HD superfamily hydrolase